MCKNPLNMSNEEIVAAVVNNFRLEGMEISEELKNECYEILEGKKTIEESIQETIRKYTNVN